MATLSDRRRTPLARARGLGSAHHGVGGFIMERATSVALVPLCLWAVWAALKIIPGGYEGATLFLSSPVNAVLAILLVLISAQHMALGMRVIVEDYIERRVSRIALLLLNSGVAWLAAAIAVFSILKVALPGLTAH